MGGYDVFYSKWIGENQWSQPVNMGSPVSTTDDDLFYYPLKNGLNGLMSRIEGTSGTSYDIYQYKNVELPNTPRYKVAGDLASVNEKNYNNFTIKVVDSRSGDTIQSLSTDTAGKYELTLPEGNFAIIVCDKKGNSSSTSISTVGAVAETMTIPQQKIEEKNAAVSEKIVPISFYLKDVLFKFNESSIQPEFNMYLDSIRQIMQKYPDLNFRIEGYADAMGDENYNLILSKKRAESIAKYLDSQYLNNKHLMITGNGIVDPAAINKNPDGSDNVMGRKYNRRVAITPATNIAQLIFIRILNIPPYLRYKTK